MPIDFSSAFPNRYLLRAHSGDGVYGWCAIEMASIMDGQLLPNESHLPFNRFLRSFVIQVNDMAFQHVSREERADALFPILPKLFGSREAEAFLPEDMTETYGGFYDDPCRFPRVEYLDRLGLPHTMRNPWGMIIAPSVSYNYEEARGTPDFHKGVDLLKKAIMVFWEQVERHGGPSPQDDFTQEQIDNLEDYIDGLPEESRSEFRREG